MITSYEVGAVFRIIDGASPALKTILAQVRELSKAIEGARANLAEIAKPAAMGSAIGATGDLAKAWGDVAKNAEAAKLAIGNASMASARAALPGAARAATGGGGRHQPGFMGRGAGGGGGGSGHLNFSGGAGAALGAAGVAVYGAYEAAQMEDAVFQLIYHSGLEQNDASRAKFRKILQGSMAESGYSLHDIAESAKQEIRMFQGTPGGGLDVLPEMLRAATIESRLKGETPEESMKALIGLAHMTKQYDPDSIKKLAPAFAFLSTANPNSLGSIERAAGYAVPLMQSGLEIDPMQSLLLGTALTRAGATNSKSGTWLREMALRAMPGTSMMTKMAFRKHEEALKAFGLVDDHDKPTWFTDGKPDIFKMLDIAGARAGSIPIEKRAAYERALFGAQGGGGFALLADPAVRGQVESLRATMNSADFKNRYAGFTKAYQEGSTVQNARTAMADLNITAMELGKNTLPSVNFALRRFKSMVEKIRDAVPGMKNDDGRIGGTGIIGAGEGAAAGFMIGKFGGPVGAVGGAVIGGVAGVAAGYLEQQARDNKARWEEESKQRSKANLDAIKGLPGGSGGVFPGGTSRTPPINFSLNVDGHALAAAVIDPILSASNHQVTTPASDGSESYGP